MTIKARGLVALMLLAASPLACRAIVGIPGGEPVVDDSSIDGGGGGIPLSPLCAAYCGAVKSNCTGDNKLYVTDEACAGTCAALPPGVEGDTMGNSVQCRLLSAKSGEAGDCQAAAPGSDGTCGSRCESYCYLIAIICPGSFKDDQECLTACGALKDDGRYDVSPEPSDDSIECRIYHLTAATFNPMHHCPHAIGVGMCPTPDGG